jgi:aspartyl-tRNA(Asn)/glutamyl-tRNA(Gln) amidotransferase subunit C
LKITNELIDKIATLSCLRIKDSEKPKFAEQLTGILGHMRVLDEVDVKNVTPMYHGCVEEKELRPDEVRPFDPAPIMKNSCGTENDYFAVPNIITGDDQ